RREQAYRRASRGEHIDLAAPGVEVWTAASISGARPQTGTSFAAPFVTAAAALLLQENPDLTPADLREQLRASARDLGAKGQDDIYGHGLLTVPEVCQE
ncbi:MAG: S8 family serine peptidase, partial [Paracoccus sp. (in: a-proteobacteria)]|nr:S8 family serine peptidase [Paracoccus sp. (in: a-proteobacteria)]